MISLIEALNYRCLRYIHRPLGPFHVLVGPNASGKTTFLDVVAFMSDLVSKDLESAVHTRTSNFQDMVWQRGDQRIELAVEFTVPAERIKLLNKNNYQIVRYEVSIGTDESAGDIIIHSERVTLKEPTRDSNGPTQRHLFPLLDAAPASVLLPKNSRGAKTVINKVFQGNDNFYDETGKGWDHSFKLGPRKSALGNLPDDESKFPVATWLKSLLMDGVQKLVLNSELMRRPCPPGQPRVFRSDGSNLPWVIDSLFRNHPDRYNDWILHLQAALPDLDTIRTIERPEDRNRYLVVKYDNNLEVPSWMVSDGTLRLMALTLPAYLPDFKGIYLIEEPENGIHPRAVETMFQSLSSVYGAQILLATHSPVILGIAEAPSVLCFAKTVEGATDIVSGSEHPALREWRGETNLGVLFAGGVLG